MSICADRKDCHPAAKLWFPLSNEPRLSVFLKLLKKKEVDTPELLAKLLACGIVNALPS
jgi:hypothetical protein